MAKGMKLDKATEEIAKRLLSLPPKHHGEMKVSRKPKEGRELTDPDVSAKQRSVSRTDRD